MRAAIIFLLVPALLAGCGTLGRLDTSKGRQATIADYDRIVIGEFTANDQRKARNEKAADEKRSDIEAGRKAFADLIEKELTEVGAFAEVSRELLPAPALKVSGTIDQWKTGNVVARTLVGFVGGSGFEATVLISDLESGEELARLKVNRNSWPLPIGSAANVVQSVELFMGLGARRVAHELAKAKGIDVAEPDADAPSPQALTRTLPVPPSTRTRPSSSAMTIKSDQWIRRMAAQQGMIEPFEPGQVRQNAAGGRIVSFGTSSYGYDVRCANEFKIFTNINSTIVDPKAFDPSSFVDVVSDVCIIPPNSFALARTVEYFRIPRSTLVVCLGKSTYARCGIIVNVTPLEPEWEGHVTLEFSNTTPLPAKIYAHEGVAQMLFFESDEVCETSYKDRGGKYQGQRGVTLPRT